MYNLVRLSTALSCYRELWPCIRQLQNLTLYPLSSSYRPTRLPMYSNAMNSGTMPALTLCIHIAYCILPTQHLLYKCYATNSSTVQCNVLYDTHSVYLDAIILPSQHLLYKCYAVHATNSSAVHCNVLYHALHTFSLHCAAVQLTTVLSCQDCTAIYPIYPVPVPVSVPV